MEDEMPNDQLERLNIRLIKVLKSIKVDAAEICSPPRFGVEVETMGLKTSQLMDLLIGWDVRRKDRRDAAKKYIEEHTPLLLIGSRMSGRNRTKEQKLIEARQHIKFFI